MSLSASEGGLHFSDMQSSVYTVFHKRPTFTQKKVVLSVYCCGQLCHLKERQVSNLRRGKIAKTINKAVSHQYYKQPSSTPQEELAAGNRDILKAISFEVRKGAKLHDNLLLH